MQQVSWFACLKASIQKLELEDLSFLLLLLLVVLAQNAWLPGFHPDGLIYAGVSERASEGLMQALIPGFTAENYPLFYMHPPLVLGLNGFFLKFLPHEWISHRLIQVGWSLMIIFSLFLFIQWQRIGRWKEWSFWAVVLFALSPQYIKLSRYPNLDIPLTFFVGLSLYFQYMGVQKGKWSSWLLSGLFFGLALLAKGPQALTILFTAGFYLIVSKNLKVLASPRPWLGLVLGGGIFMLWPVALKLVGRPEVFSDYLHHQVFPTVGKSRGLQKLDLLGYFKILLKTTPHGLILALYGAFGKYKLYRNPLFLFFLSWFAATLIPFSFMSLKYSHYITSLYPALIAMAALTIAQWEIPFQLKLQSKLKTLTQIAILILLIFPVTSGRKRDPELHHALAFYRASLFPPEKIYVIDFVVGEYTTKNLFGMRVKKDVNYLLSKQWELEKLADKMGETTHITFVSPDMWIQLSQLAGFKEKHQIYRHFPRINVLLVGSKSLMDYGLGFYDKI